MEQIVTTFPIWCKMHYDRPMKHRFWFFFFAISLLVHAVIFFTNLREGRKQMQRERMGIDIQIKAHSIKKEEFKEPVEKDKQNQKKIVEEKLYKKSQKRQQEVVTAKTFDNQILQFVAPLYPRSARRIGASGIVEVLIKVNPSGKVESVELVKGASYDAFNTAVLKVASNWKFKPQKLTTTFKKKIVFTID
ncbi:energy transducer TonB [Halobacteriovorax vibrionivorans]|uniref:Energy transducer TonB n=2 Tax=Halobacteriovoraceae TaxID=1652132 RepID=A0ABY0IER8_9BACT|nr:energy transducer TonB [Halobacteriovorax vibrionivorans]TGD46300.1 energy transducer TonB [Halobacteriovorax sp. Y22]